MIKYACFRYAVHAMCARKKCLAPHRFLTHVPCIHVCSAHAPGANSIAYTMHKYVRRRSVSTNCTSRRDKVPSGGFDALKRRLRSCRSGIDTVDCLTSPRSSLKNIFSPGSVRKNAFLKQIPIIARMTPDWHNICRGSFGGDSHVQTSMATVDKTVD